MFKILDKYYQRIITINSIQGIFELSVIITFTDWQRSVRSKHLIIIAYKTYHLKYKLFTYHI